MIVIPNSFIFSKHSITCNALKESSPVVGSSKNNRLGLLINSIPILTLFFSPPEIPLI